MSWETLLITNQGLLTPRESLVAVSISENEILICGGAELGAEFVLNTSSANTSGEHVLRRVFNDENLGFESNSN